MAYGEASVKTLHTHQSGRRHTNFPDGLPDLAKKVLVEFCTNPSDFLQFSRDITANKSFVTFGNLWIRSRILGLSWRVICNPSNEDFFCCWWSTSINCLGNWFSCFKCFSNSSFVLDDIVDLCADLRIRKRARFWLASVLAEPSEYWVGNLRCH
jgi:hypothetical protein